MSNTRRIFFMQSLSCVTAPLILSIANSAQAQTAAITALTEDGPQAIALGYKTDGTKADVKKYPNYAASQSCEGCVLFQGKATDATGSCAVFGNKLVARKGWCSAWTKKV